MEQHALSHPLIPDKRDPEHKDEGTGTSSTKGAARWKAEKDLKDKMKADYLQKLKIKDANLKFLRFEFDCKCVRGSLPPQDDIDI